MGDEQAASTEAAHSLHWTLLCQVFWSQGKKMDHERALVDPPMEVQEVQEVQEILPEEKGILHSAEFLLILGSVGSMLYMFISFSQFKLSLISTFSQLSYV